MTKTTRKSHRKRPCSKSRKKGLEISPMAFHTRMTPATGTKTSNGSLTRPIKIRRTNPTVLCITLSMMLISHPPPREHYKIYRLLLVFPLLRRPTPEKEFTIPESRRNERMGRGFSYFQPRGAEANLFSEPIDNKCVV